MVSLLFIGKQRHYFLMFGSLELGRLVVMDSACQVPVGCSRETAGENIDGAYPNQTPQLINRGAFMCTFRYCNKSVGIAVP